jgi:hypothetical protein
LFIIPQALSFVNSFFQFFIFIFLLFCFLRFSLKGDFTKSLGIFALNWQKCTFQINFF